MYNVTRHSINNIQYIYSVQMFLQLVVRFYAKTKLNRLHVWQKGVFINKNSIDSKLFSFSFISNITLSVNLSVEIHGMVVS